MPNRKYKIGDVLWSYFDHGLTQCKIVDFRRDDDTDPIYGCEDVSNQEFPFAHKFRLPFPESFLFETKELAIAALKASKTAKK